MAWQFVLLGAISGLIIGSFVGALTWRWPAGRSIVHGRSRCDHCDAVLTARDLVPLLSFVALHGHCRHCGETIAVRHLAIEGAAALVGGLAFAVAPGLPGVAGAIFGWSLLALAILDVENFWLPDRLTLPLVLAGLTTGFWLAPPMLDRVIGATVGFSALAVIAAIYRARTGRIGLGGGDPRLMAAIGAWLGWSVLPVVLLVAALLGLVLVAIDNARGRAVTRYSRVAFGALLAVSAWPIWLVGVG